MAKRLLTASGMKAFRACPRRYQYAYVRGYRPHKTALALRFGTWLHAAIEAYWRARQRGEARDDWWGIAHAALLEAMGADVDPYVSRHAQVLLRLYVAVWNQTKCAVLAVEAKFEFPLVHPRSGARSLYWVRAGKIDLILRLADGRIALTEHKSTSQDASAGSSYRRRLTLDEQLSQYLEGARSLGYEPDVIVYDVLRKFAEKPLEATPEDNRIYTKPTKADPVPRLRKGQRERAETPDEYEARLIKAGMAAPDKRIVRVGIVRTRQERVAADFNVWALARAIDVATAEDGWFYNSDECERFHGQTCPYLGVCEGTESLDDPTKFRRLSDVHAELVDPPAEET